MHLAKLRAIFDDPLLLPGPRGMRPTVRAEQLRGPLIQALPALNGLRSAAPGTRLAVLETTPSRIAKLAEQGEIDLAFHTREGAPTGLRQRTLFSERYVLAGRVGHPKLHENLTLAQFCELEQVMVSPDGAGFCGITGQALADVGLTRRVVLSVPHFLFVISVLTQSELAVPGFEMTMLWHKRSHRDPAHQWLREHIVRLV